MAATTSFKTEFAVSMECEDCVDDIQKRLRTLDDIERYDVDLKDQRVVVEGRAPPSKISRLLKDTGRQVIVRGTGTTDGTHSGAAVCIFESHSDAQDNLAWESPEHSQKVHGIARLIQANDSTCLIDLTVRRGDPSFISSPIAEAAKNKLYSVHVAQTGNISKGAKSTGPVMKEIGELKLDEAGYGDLFVEKTDLKVWECIGRAMVVAEREQGEPKEAAKGILAGVIARSAGAWENDKTVCSCTGQSMWAEERLASSKMVANRTTANKGEHANEQANL